MTIFSYPFGLFDPTFTIEKIYPIKYDAVKFSSKYML